MKITSFTKELQTKNFEFITNIASHVPSDNLLDDKIKSYLQQFRFQLEPAIDAFTKNKASKTEVIIAIHDFIKQNRNLLIEIYKHASSQELVSDSASKHYKAVKEEAFKLLQQGRKFNYWAENIISKESFANKTHLLSRDMSAQKKSKASPNFVRAPDESDVNRDITALINGNGVSLPERLQREHLDPQHRAWGTMYPPTQRRLEPVHDAWAIQADKSEDLTVEIEFDEQKKTNTNILNYYFSYEEAMECMLSSNSQHELCLSGGTTPFSTAREDFIFAMDMQGNLFVYKDDQYKDGKRIGHPAFTRGEAVACAGEISIENGKVTQITNGSGHYMPGGYSLHRVVKALHDRQVLAPNCVIEDIRGEFFITEKKEDEFAGKVTVFERNRRRLSWNEYSACYEEKAKNFPPAQVVDVSEKHNPLLLLNGIKALHEHIKERGHKTAGIGVTSNSYFLRREHFKQILHALKNKDYDSALKYIDEGRIKFQNKSPTAPQYIALLDKLRTELVHCKNHPVSVLNDGFVHAKIENYCDMYQLMDKVSRAMRDYVNNHTFLPSSKNNELQAKINEAANNYKYKRQELPDNYRKEFENKEETQEVELNNWNKLSV